MAEVIVVQLLFIVHTADTNCVILFPAQIIIISFWINYYQLIAFPAKLKPIHCWVWFHLHVPHSISDFQIIHRDLAARNILITDDHTCKVADFGFARDVITSKIYERKSEGKLPIRYDDVWAMNTASVSEWNMNTEEWIDTARQRRWRWQFRKRKMNSVNSEIAGVAGCQYYWNCQI